MKKQFFIVGVVLIAVAIVAALVFSVFNPPVTASARSPISVQLSFNETPTLNNEVILRAVVTSSQNSPNTIVVLDLPNEVDFVGGDLKWEGDLAPNQPVEITAQIKLNQGGDFPVKATIETENRSSSSAVSVPISQIPQNSSIGVGGVAAGYNNTVVECEENRHCPDNKYCDTNTCRDVVCFASCSHVTGHECVPYQCCVDSDCAQGFSCIEHECRYPVFNSTNKIAFLIEGSLYTMNRDGSAVAKLTDGNSRFDHYRPNWSPDGRKLVGGHFMLFTINADGTNKTNFSEGADPVWMPDGRILFYIDKNPYYGIVALNLTANETTRIFLAIEIVHLALTADGERIAYSRNNPTNPNVIVTVNSNGTELTQYSFGYEPSWSPDGRLLAISFRGVRILDTITGQDRFLVSGSTPSWSPNGNQIAFTRPEGGIAVINVDGTGQVNLTDSGTWPSWSPRQD